MAVAGRDFGDDGDLRLGFFRVEREMAFSAKVIVGPELDEVTVVAPQYFP
jgi:hypothetical protein